MTKNDNNSNFNISLILPNCNDISCRENDERSGTFLFSSYCNEERVSGKFQGGNDFKYCLGGSEGSSIVEEHLKAHILEELSLKSILLVVKVILFLIYPKAELMLNTVFLVVNLRSLN